MILAALSLAACSDAADTDAEEEATRPLQPLIYTEYPDLTPDGAAVRERRIMRQLLEGDGDRPWGMLDSSDAPELPETADPDALGQAVVEALLERDEKLWEHVFISPRDYSDLVNIRLPEAAEFVDNRIGESFALWKLFTRTHSSEIPEGGLKRQFDFEEIELGQDRDIHGSPVGEDSETVQYWNNRIVLRHRDTDVLFTLKIPRIFRLQQHSDVAVDDGGLPDADVPDDGEEIADPDAERTHPTFVYHVASQIEPSSDIITFLDAGLHLKPQLLRAKEYPFPLGIGSFWRYRRFDADQGAMEDDPLERRFDDRPEGLHAEELIVEVRDVSRYDPIRLVELLYSYEDRRHSRIREWWVLTPRRIYHCDTACRENIDDIGWLLDYFQTQIPLLKLPLRLAEQWGRGGRSDGDENVFEVQEDWHQIETPAGAFAGTYRIHGTGPLATNDRYLRDVELVREFAPGRGIIRRQITPSETSEERVRVIEELVEYRIMY